MSKRSKAVLGKPDAFNCTRISLTFTTYGVLTLRGSPVTVRGVTLGPRGGVAGAVLGVRGRGVGVRGGVTCVAVGVRGGVTCVALAINRGLVGCS